MQFKYKMVIVSTLLFSIHAVAASWPYEEKHLLKQMNEAYAALDTKTGFCHELEARKISEVKSDWLYSLSEQKQRKVIFAVSQLAAARCVQQEQREYVWALMNYTSTTKDKSHLERWLTLNSVYDDKNVFNSISDIPYQKIQALSERSEFYYPFNPIESAKLIVPETK
jgi:hypothetical protein